MASLCILCKNKPAIKNSHVVPNFVVKRLKKGNPIGTLIHSKKLNKVEQDGWKADYLCKDCEERFSKLEDWFCKEVYDPFLDNQISSFNYSSQLLEFSLSLYFRYSKLLIEDCNQSEQDCSPILNISNDYRRRLLSNDYKHFFTYLAFHREVTDLRENYEPGINTYFFEAIDGGMFDYYFVNSGAGTEKTWMIYVKMPCMYFLWSEIELPSPFIDNQVKLDGTFGIPARNSWLDLILKDTFNRRALDIQNNYFRMDPKRVERNKNKILGTKNINDFRATRSYELDLALVNQKLNPIP